MPSFKKFYKENGKKAIQSWKTAKKLLQLVMTVCSYNFNVAIRISINLRRDGLFFGKGRILSHQYAP